MFHIPNHLQALQTLQTFFSPSSFRKWDPWMGSMYPQDAVPGATSCTPCYPETGRSDGQGFTAISVCIHFETINFRTWKVIISRSSARIRLYQVQNSEVFMISSCINFRTWKVFMIWRCSEAPLMYQGGTEFIVVFFIYPKPQCAGRWGSQKIIKVNKKPAEEHVIVWRAGVNANGILLQDMK